MRTSSLGCGPSSNRTGSFRERARSTRASHHWQDVELVRRLRNKIGHGSGNYDPNDKDKKKLFDSIVDYYKVPQGYSYFDVEKYPIGIKQVLVPMAHGCKTYAAAYLEVKKGG